MFKKWIMVSIAIPILFTTILGCSSSKSSETTATPVLEQSPDMPKDDATAPMKDGKFDPPITMTTIRDVGGDVKFKSGETIENNVLNTWFHDKMGIDVKHLWTASGGDAYNNKLRLSLSANEPLPDVFVVNDGQLINDFIDSGKVMDISQLWEQYASPRIKKIYGDFPQAFYPSTKDGKKYGVPLFTGGNVSDNVMWIRKDWLDKLNLQAPKTLDELEKVMDAFVNQDPDGNNKKDTIGISAQGKSYLGAWMGDLGFVFGGLGNIGMPGMWSKAADGTLQYASVQPQAKDGLLKLRDWFAKGYLDKELGILDETKASDSFVQGRSGIITCGTWFPGWPMPDLLKNHPEAKVIPIPIPSGVDGKIGRWGEGVQQGQILFSKDFKHIDAFFKYLDTGFDSVLNDGEFKDGYFEGYDYVMKDGKKSFGGKDNPDKVDVGAYYLTRHTQDIPYNQIAVMKKLAEGAQPANSYEEGLLAKDKLELEAAVIDDNQNDYKMTTEFIGSPTTTMQAKGEFLKKIELETFMQIIYGKGKIEDFDTFVSQWKSGGGDEITKEVNEWYVSVTKK
ncbi:MAG: extracellular solute-binding protein [Gorillibacterium sp.]|nr:extracellular solute-binding protein [Gorillibacterium sp.]